MCLTVAFITFLFMFQYLSATILFKLPNCWWLMWLNNFYYQLNLLSRWLGILFTVYAFCNFLHKMFTIRLDSASLPLLSVILEENLKKKNSLAQIGIGFRILVTRKSADYIEVTMLSWLTEVITITKHIHNPSTDSISIAVRLFYFIFSR